MATKYESGMHMDEELQKYDAADAWCREVVKTGHELLFDPGNFHDDLCRASKGLNFPLESLHSLLRNIHLVHVKKYSYILRNDIRRHLREYSRGKTILEIARGLNYPPYMVARNIVENIADFGAQNTRKAITEAMRDPEGILGDSDVLCSEYRASELNRLPSSRGLDTTSASR
mmetsp:Transcript_10955/g.32424  ORF Transcript_10955/g.32424 Transcript_10955/m.32424 type:complete len:173 (-) Transcript_10955:1346-1864(-)